MNKIALDEVMNCKCLQTIIKQDEKKHTVNSERWNLQTIQAPTGKGAIIFQCFTSYRDKKINLETGVVIKDRTEQDFCGVPFLYCPLCGSKTKIAVPEKSFYAQFQNIDTP